MKPFGYKAGDLVYYKQPTKKLDEGLQLVSSDYDVLEMIKCHKGQSIIVLYVVSFDAQVVLLGMLGLGLMILHKGLGCSGLFCSRCLGSLYFREDWDARAH
ncbi:hypothetical protein CJ030_MR2G006820 [Morella rubra]|uniref:Uncharacterized protein n=1 Tax=Morella rubra TaxID=262757 RepID=A0A6A1WFG7_9ROSI|nr:hypothetical protein CJ030_MR2G006820 [Morella rubra]